MALGACALPLLVPAVDGNRDAVSGAEAGLVWDSTLNATFDPRCVACPAVPLSPSERGCIASHVRAWRLLADPSSGDPVLRLHRGLRRGGERWFVVCEDDAQLDGSDQDLDLPAALERVLGALPADCELCYLGHVIPRGAARTRVGKLFLRPSYLWQLHAYMLTSATAARLLARLPCAEPVDNFLARMVHDGALNALALRTQLFRQRALGPQRRDSDIQHSGSGAARG